MGIHPGQTGNLLSGASAEGTDRPVGDHGWTRSSPGALVQDTPQSSIVLACEQPMTGYHETSFSMAYSSHISWQSADSPVPTNLSLAGVRHPFENRGSLRNQSILDRVRERADGLSHEVSASDRAKLDEYLTSVREVEKRIARTASGGRRPRAVVFSMDRPRTGCRKTSGSTRG